MDDRSTVAAEREFIDEHIGIREPQASSHDVPVRNVDGEPVARHGTDRGHATNIGLEGVDTGIWNIYFNQVLLAKLDERDYIIRMQL